MKRALTIARKETFHILRDPFTLAMAIGLPVALVLIFGLAIDFNVNNIDITVHDGDKSSSSRLLGDVFSRSGYFHLRSSGGLISNTIRDLDAERSKGALIIEPGFERDLRGGKAAQAQFILDGADNSTAGTILSYLNGVQASAAAKFTGQQPKGLEIRPSFLFNPELNSSWFVVPGLAAVVISVLSVLLTALTVAREWENGSMELLLSTPVHPMEIIIGKLIPYTVIGLIGLALVVVVALIGFSIPFVGNFFLFLVASLMFLVSSLAQGLLISVMTRRQQLAMQVAMVTGLLPSLLLSGFIFPIESMPKAFHFITSVLPAKWFMLISRALFLKGASLWDLRAAFAALIALNVVLIAIATRKFKKDLEP